MQPPQRSACCAWFLCLQSTGLPLFPSNPVGLPGPLRNPGKKPISNSQEANDGLQPPLIANRSTKSPLSDSGDSTISVAKGMAHYAGSLQLYALMTATFAVPRDSRLVLWIR